MNQRPSALAGFGITQWPTGTKQQIEERGLDPKTASSCAEPAPGVKGCPRWAECRFHNPSMGGFKGHGPQYIGYRVINPADGTVSQDVTVCWNYVHTLQPSADAGAALRRVTNGKQGQIIRVIAQEGDTIVTQYDLPINGDGKVVNVMPEMVPILDANDIAYSTRPGEVSIGRRFFELKRPVPKFQSPNTGGPGSSFAQRVAQWDMENEGRDRDSDFMEAGAIEPQLSAEPKRGPGRPRKVEVTE